MSTSIQLPLIDKYSPKNINSIILPINIEQKVKRSIARKTIENTLICGQNGVGKSILLNIWTKTVLGTYFDSACLNLNTTIYRGLKDLNEILPSFCDRYIVNFEGKKIIMIDKVDNLTKKAQHLIPNIMNDNPTISFIMTCDDPRKVSSAIVDKCYFLYMPPIENEKIIRRLESICCREEIYYTDEALEIIVNSCDGDIRSAINLLDNINNGFTIINVENTKALLYRPSSSEIKKFINMCINKSTRDAIDFINRMKGRGFCGTDILLSIIDTLKIIKIKEEIKINYISIIVEHYIHMTEELDSDLQLYSCISRLIKFNPS